MVDSSGTWFEHEGKLDEPDTIFDDTEGGMEDPPFWFNSFNPISNASFHDINTTFVR